MSFHSSRENSLLWRLPPLIANWGSVASRRQPHLPSSYKVHLRIGYRRTFPLFFSWRPYLFFLPHPSPPPLSNLLPKVEETEIRGSHVVSKLDKSNTRSPKRSTQNTAVDKEIANHIPNTLKKERNFPRTNKTEVCIFITTYIPRLIQLYIQHFFDVCANMAGGNSNAIAEFLRHSRPFCLWNGCPLLRPCVLIQSNVWQHSAWGFCYSSNSPRFSCFSWYRTWWVIIIAFAFCSSSITTDFLLIFSVSVWDNAVLFYRLF